LSHGGRVLFGAERIRAWHKWLARNQMRGGRKGRLPVCETAPASANVSARVVAAGGKMAAETGVADELKHWLAQPAIAAQSDGAFEV